MIRNELFERRKHRRVKIDAEIKHREVMSDDFMNDNRNLAGSLAANISKGGMQIITDTAWTEAGDRLIEVELSVMNRDIKVIAHVVWFLFDEKIKKYRSGLEFIVIKSGDLEAISNIV